jgi:hypothetical protein
MKHQQFLKFSDRPFNKCVFLLIKLSLDCDWIGGKSLLREATDTLKPHFFAQPNPHSTEAKSILKPENLNVWQILVFRFSLLLRNREYCIYSRVRNVVKTVLGMSKEY